MMNVPSSQQTRANLRPRRWLAHFHMPCLADSTQPVDTARTVLRILTAIIALSVLVTVFCTGTYTAASPAPKIAETSGSLVFEDPKAGYRFSYPSTAILDESSKNVADAFGNTHLVQFTHNDTTYVISGIYGERHGTIEQWLRDPKTGKGFPLSAYKKITVDGRPAYQWKDSLVTMLMIRGTVFELSAFEKGATQASQKLDDPVYRELLNSFQGTR